MVRMSRAASSKALAAMTKAVAKPKPRLRKPTRISRLPAMPARLLAPVTWPRRRPAWPSLANSMVMLWMSGMNRCWPTLKRNNQASITP